jgi:hypothetical protein
MKTYYFNSDGQQVFDRTLAFLPFCFGLFVKIFVYSPLLLSGYLIVKQILPIGAKGYYWVGSIIFVALILYGLLFIVKGILIALRARSNKSWIFLMPLCIIYTSVPPGLITYDLLRTRIPYHWLTLALSMAAGYWAYTRYHFLVDLVPSQMWGLYAIGLRLGRYPQMKKSIGK